MHLVMQEWLNIRKSINKLYEIMNSSINNQ